MNQRHLLHLYNRASFGLDITTLNSLAALSKNEIVSNLITASKNYTPLTIDLSEFQLLKERNIKKLRAEIGEKALQELQQKSRKKVDELNTLWIDRLSNSSSNLREKMTLFWANVFVCSDNNILHIHQYNNTLRKHALGNFRQFVKAISKEPSMMKYLNLNQNVKGKPNENFARELMELFTLGIGNYSENDIKEAARAFTGYKFNRAGFKLRKDKHDYSEKTFLNKTGNFNGDDIIDIILEQKQCARFICTKIYQYFVNPVVDEKRLEALVDVFYKDYDIKNLMSYMFSSSWFYREENIGVKIKSPIELLAGMQKIVPFTVQNKKRVKYLQKMMGQMLLYPPNVAGWKGDKSWIDSNTLMFRMRLPSILLNNAVINLAEKGEFEDSFEQYYKKEKNRKKYIKTIVNWNDFEDKYGKLSPKKLRKLIIAAQLDKDTAQLIDNLKVNSNKEFCVQLMSLPEYQLC